MSSKTPKLTRRELASLEYHDLFSYPMTQKELERWKTLRLRTINKTKYDWDGKYFFLEGSHENTKKRIQREKYSQQKFELVEKYHKFFLMIPTINFVGITGSLAMRNADKNSDIDLLVIVRKNTLWTTRAFLLLILKIFKVPVRRKRTINQKDKLCLNMWFDESALTWPKKERNIYTAHEIMQIVPLINKNKTYEELLSKNKWVFNHWQKSPKVKFQRPKTVEKQPVSFFTLLLFHSFTLFNSLAYFVQRIYMVGKISNEIVSHNKAVFHPHNLSHKIISGLQTKGILE